MLNFFETYWSQILLTLTSTIIGLIAKNAFSKLKEYQQIIEQQNEDEIIAKVQLSIKPLLQEIQDLKENIETHYKLFEEQKNIIVEGYKFRLIQICKNHLERGYLNSEEFEQLSEFYKVYSKLGGNDQGKDYYEKTIKLPIKEKKEQ